MRILINDYRVRRKIASPQRKIKPHRRLLAFLIVYAHMADTAQFVLVYIFG